MMPVVRISETTWDRMKTYARQMPFASPDDVIGAALDVLDIHGLPIQIEKTKIRPKPIRRGNKLPQKEFRIPLLETLLDLGGKSAVKHIRMQLEPKVAARLSEADYALVSTGEPRWWNAACWERSALVKEGLLKDSSERGVWELSDLGRNFLASRR